MTTAVDEFRAEEPAHAVSAEELHRLRDCERTLRRLVPTLAEAVLIIDTSRAKICECVESLAACHCTDLDSHDYTALANLGKASGMIAALASTIPLIAPGKV